MPLPLLARMAGRAPPPSDGGFLVGRILVLALHLDAAAAAATARSRERHGVGVTR